MMYPRLFLARNLLKEDGVIFISIDDDEVKNLRMICDEIFGEENFVGDIIRKTKSMTADESTGFNFQHENLVIYAKNKELLFLLGEEKTFDNYSNTDNDINGDWTSGDPSAKSGGGSTYFGIKNPYTNKIDYPPKGRYWAFSQTSFNEYVKKGKIKFKKSYKNTERGFIFKRYKKELNSLYNPVHSLFAIENNFMNQVGTKEVQELLGGEYFDNPKPIAFIKKLIKYSLNDTKDGVVLDFFSGSGTTAHAIMALNAEDGGTRKCISVQLPEPTDEKSEAYKAGYKTISQITKERIRRAGKKIKEENPDKNIDIGFKVFKLDESNFKQWDKNITDSETLKQSLMDFENNVEEGSDKLNMLYELLLKKGLDINSKIEKVNVVDNEIFIVGGGMYVCIDDKISEETIDKVIEARPVHFIVLDKAFEGNDQLKTNTFQTFKTLYETSENPFETV